MLHILFLHQNFPAQFGQIAQHLARHRGYRCTFVSEREVPDTPEIKHVRFVAQGGARSENHYCSRTFENQIWRSHAVYEALKQRPEIRPDLIVAHSGFVSSMFLRQLYPDVPHINYFEFFYHTHGSDLDFRQDLHPASEMDLLRVQARNAQLLLDLHYCDLGYSPTQFQRSQLPVEYQTKIRTIFDGIDTDVWQPRSQTPDVYNGIKIPAGHRLVTYVSRGFEAMRGFDIFLRAADRICRERKDVTVIVVGEDRVAYGGDLRYTNGKSFKDWTIERYKPNLDRIHFIGRLPPTQLALLLARSDLHLYLTAPFVLSWSLMNALSCGCRIVASDTAPVREMIRSGDNGLLVDFFDIDGFVEQSLRVLDQPTEFARFGIAGRQMIEREYSIPHCLKQMESLYASVLALPR